MNDRIKELREQAFDWVQYQLQTIGSDHSVMQNEQLHMVNEKFAELIIQECCLEIAEEAAKHSQYGMGVLAVSSNSIARIKRHFGMA